MCLCRSIDNLVAADVFNMALIRFDNKWFIDHDTIIDGALEMKNLRSSRECWLEIVIQNRIYFISNQVSAADPNGITCKFTDRIIMFQAVAVTGNRYDPEFHGACQLLFFVAGIGEACRECNEYGQDVFH